MKFRNGRIVRENVERNQKEDEVMKKRKSADGSLWNHWRIVEHHPVCALDH
jgi:flagellar biosynthesis/type III secretory pathway chaperone